MFCQISIWWRCKCTQLTRKDLNFLLQNVLERKNNNCLSINCLFLQFVWSWFVSFKNMLFPRQFAGRRSKWCLCKRVSASGSGPMTTLKWSFRFNNKDIWYMIYILYILIAFDKFCNSNQKYNLTWILTKKRNRQ